MTRSVEGVRFERSLAGTFSKETTVRPLRDGILVKVTAWTPSKILEVEYHGKPLRGVVVRTGPGCYPKRYNRDRSRTWDSKAFRRCEVKVGDTVELGGLELRGYDFTQVLIGNELHVLCREEDVVGIKQESYGGTD